MPSTPAATARSASSARSTPFSISLRGQRSRNRLMSSQREGGIEHAVADEGVHVAPGSEFPFDVDETRTAPRDRGDPAWMHQHVEPRRERELLVRQQAGAQVALPLAGDGEIARQDHALESGVMRARDDRVGDAPFREHVGLQPQSSGRFAGDVLEQAHRDGGHRERHAAGCGGLRELHVPVRPGKSVERRRTHDDGKRGRRAEQARREVALRNVDQRARAEQQPFDRPRDCRAG